MRWIIGVVVGLVAGMGLVLLLDHDRHERPAPAVTSVPRGAEASPSDTGAAERAGCEALRAMGAAAEIGDWYAVAVTLRGTRLAEEAAEVERQAATNSRSATYGAVLDVLEGCLRIGA
jgi:hypothetical protein